MGQRGHQSDGKLPPVKRWRDSSFRSKPIDEITLSNQRITGKNFSNHFSCNFTNRASSSLIAQFAFVQIFEFIKFFLDTSKWIQLLSFIVSKAQKCYRKFLILHFVKKKKFSEKTRQATTCCRLFLSLTKHFLPLRHFQKQTWL